MAPLEEADQVRPGNTQYYTSTLTNGILSATAAAHLFKHNCKAFWTFLLVSKHPSSLPSPDQLASLLATALSQLKFICAAHVAETRNISNKASRLCYLRRSLRVQTRRHYPEM